MARLPGRNDPCPCGSGRKFKKCHLQGLQVWRRLTSGPTHLDPTELKIAFCLAMGGDALIREVDARAEAVEREYFGVYPEGSVLVPEEAEQPLIAWLRRLELEMAQLAASNSKYFWLFLTQRMKPSKERFGTSALTVKLYRQVLKLAVLKHGGMEGTPFTSLPKGYDARWWIGRLDDGALPRRESEPNSSLVPVSVSLDDIGRAVLMERLARDFCGAAALLRRVWKGGQLPVNGGCAGNAVHDPETAWLIELYDERLRYGEVLSHFGSIVSTGFGPEGGSQLFCLIPQYNLEGTRVPVVWESAEGCEDDLASVFGGAQYCPNYVVVPADLGEFLKKAKRFRSALAEAHGFAAEDLICYLVALSYRELIAWRQRTARRLQLWQRGYVPVNEDALLRDLASFFSEVGGLLGRRPSEQEAVERVRALTSALRYERQDFERIDLWSRSGLKLLLPVESGVLIDFHAIPAILHDLFQPLAKMSGEVGRLKGRDLEDEVATVVEREVPEAKVIWRRKVIARSTPEQREVDVGVVKADALFVLQCKAHAVEPAYDRGSLMRLTNGKA